MPAGRSRIEPAHAMTNTAHFVPMDRQAELAWRIRLEGSRGIGEREFAGPVIGLQQLYRDGLRAP